MQELVSQSGVQVTDAKNIESLLSQPISQAASASHHKERERQTVESAVLALIFPPPSFRASKFGIFHCILVYSTLSSPRFINLLDCRLTNMLAWCQESSGDESPSDLPEQKKRNATGFVDSDSDEVYIMHI